MVRLRLRSPIESLGKSQTEGIKCEVVEAGKFGFKTDSVC